MRSLRLLLVLLLVIAPVPVNGQTAGTLVRGTLLSACEDVSKVASVAISASSSGNNQIVALSGSTRIYICSIKLNVAGAVTVQPIYGTGSACATGETDMDTWVFTEQTTAPWGFPNTGSPQYQRTPTGQAFCLELSASVSVTGSLTYVQQ